VSKCWKQEKTNWREIALFQPKPAMSGCTGLSGGAPDNVRWCTGQCPVCQAGSGKLGALGNKLTAYDYNSPDCPVCTGLSGVHRTVSGAPTAPRRQRSASPNKEGDPHRTVSGGAPDCPVRQAAEGKNFLPRLLSMAPSYLGAIKGTPRRMKENTKHPLSTLDHSHSILAHLFDILVI
jgi:hypothetical protein